MAALRLPKSSPDQWVALAAVVDHGGYGGAAEALRRSASALNYQVQRLQEQLGVRLLEVQGRRAVLTPHGEILLKRARGLLAELDSLESLAGSLQAGFEPVLRVVVDAAFPRGPLLAALAELQVACPQTRLELADAVLSGAEEAIAGGTADLVVTSRVPRGFLGDWLLETTFVAVAAPAHPLQRLGRPATLEAGATRRVPLYLVLVHAANAGPAARTAAEVLHRHSLGLAAPR